MIDRLGIVTGFGGLSEEVLALANKLPDGYTRFIVKPWIPRPPILFGVFSDRFSRSKGVAIDPFHFLEIEEALTESNIKRVFFTGDFPRDRYLQVYFGNKVWGGFDKIADEKCIRYFNETDNELLQPVRYFLALSRLLNDDLKIKPLLASQIFPELNIPAGCSSTASPPDEVLALLPDLIVSVGKKLALTPQNRTRFAQAVIVDHGIILEVEARGTNELINRYAKSRIRRRMPFLLKPPSVEFNPALDQPTIGPDTVDYCRAAGVRGIVVCAETTTIVAKSLTIQRINDCGMFLYALPFSELRQTYVQNFSNTWMQNAPITARPPLESSLPPTDA